MTAWSQYPSDGREPVPFRAIRSRDQLVLRVGGGFLTFDETIVMKPIGLKEKLPPGRPNLMYVLIPPLWLKDGTVDRPAFSTLKPYYQSSQGRIRGIALRRPDGEKVLTPDQITPECRYILTLEFGHVVPDEFTVTIGFTSASGINPSAEFIYTPSNDGYPIRSGSPESVFTELRVNADGPLAPWKVWQGTDVLSRHTPYAVQLTREASHVIRFAQE
ncbi:MAG: hypothetical protein EXS38_02455 [Opitutus sp.]|nr:hypothetical protein [Opitutus sp.]